MHWYDEASAWRAEVPAATARPAAEPAEGRRPKPLLQRLLGRRRPAPEWPAPTSPPAGPGPTLPGAPQRRA
jgi:hypothetical protein